MAQLGGLFVRWVVMTTVVPQLSCNHDWQPVSGWYGRYRCRNCGAFGMKQRVVMRAGGNTIRPYSCNMPGCGLPAVTRSSASIRRRSWRCQNHR